MDTLAEAVSRATLADFRAAANRVAADAIRTPLLPFSHADGRTIALKPENLQPYGSFKIRCGANVIAQLSDAELAGGVATASAGNFAQGLTLAARRRNARVTVHVPDTAAGVKLAAVRALGARIVSHSFADWWQIMSTRETGAADGAFVHPVCEPGVILGNGSIGLELAADWPELDTVVVPFGGGGLISGIALALRAAGKRVRIVACEVETAAALDAAMKAGTPVTIDRAASFVDGIGSTGVLPQMWPLLRELVDDVVVVTLDETKAALRRLALESHMIAEGAGAAALAAAERCGGSHVAAVISGGNLDPAILSGILGGG